MPFGSSQWMYASGGFYNSVATQSLRFDDGSSAYLTRTPSASNRKTHTLSMWVKRCELGGGSVNNSLLRANGSGDTGRTDIFFDANDKLNVAGSSTYFRITNQVFRDTSAWYHLVFALDTTQSTASDRFKIYVNGSQITSFGTSNDYSLNTDYGINGNVAHQIGTGYDYFDGYMAEVNFIDGTQLDPTSFGELKNGVWIPIEYTGSYGTNGFRLQFNQTGTGTASSSTIGADTSGNANHFTSSGIVASDCDMPDSPENNFATLNPLRHNISGSESDGNLRYVNTATSSEHRNYGTFGLTSGKFYWEGRCEGTNPDAQIGLGGVSETLTSNTYRISYKSLNGATVGLSGATYSTFGNGDIIGVAYDADNTQITFYKNNTAQTGSPVSITADTQGMFPMLITYNEGSTSNSGWIMNFGQDSSFVGNETAQGNTDGNANGDFYYSPPSGYLALCTANLPKPTISPNAGTNKQADDYFNTVLYTGNGGSSTLAVTGMGFSADWLWFKNRSSANDHNVYDTNRGLSSGALLTNTNVAEDSVQRVSSIDADGFTLPATLYSYVNTSGNSYVTWGWKAGGTAVLNEQGSINSNVSANTDAGFSIVKHTGTGSNGTIGHNLGKKPALIITKGLSSGYSWFVYNHISGATKALILNSTGAEASYSTTYNNTEPTTSVFSVGTATATNGSGINYINYVFAEIEGFSKFGSYTGNGSTTPADGTFVYTSFKPLWLMVKRTDLTGQWRIYDTKRSPINYMDELLSADASDAEAEGSTSRVDFLSNGFKWRGSASGTNKDGGTYIYMAFAETPFKYANAR